MHKNKYDFERIPKNLLTELKNCYKNLKNRDDEISKEIFKNLDDKLKMGLENLLI